MGFEIVIVHSSLFVCSIFTYGNPRLLALFQGFLLILLYWTLENFLTLLSLCSHNLYLFYFLIHLVFIVL